MCMAFGMADGSACSFLDRWSILVAIGPHVSKGLPS
jgi:hypothetical protein